jgi:hypothetical protein
VTSLDDLQRFIADIVRRRTMALDDASTHRADALIAPSPRGMRPAERLEVYREQFWMRHLPNLAEDYPTLSWAIGAAAFRDLAIDYLCAHPPRTWDLQRLGADLPAHAARYAAGDRARIAGDAARLDWAFVEAFDAPDAPPFDPSVLASTPEDAWPAARVEVHPSLRMLALGHPVHEIRDALSRGETPPMLAPADRYVVVWRDPRCYLRSVAIEPLAFALLGELGRGAPLGDACESVAKAAGVADPGELGPSVAAWFQEWTGRAWVSAVRHTA